MTLPNGAGFFPEYEDVPRNLSDDYPISCEVCGELIVDEEDDFNGMCSECYDTPPDEL